MVCPSSNSWLNEEGRSYLYQFLSVAGKLQFAWVILTFNLARRLLEAKQMAWKPMEKVLSVWLLPVELRAGKLFVGEYSVQLATCLLTSSKEDIKLLKLPLLGRLMVDKLAVSGHEALRKWKNITADDGVKQVVPGSVPRSWDRIIRMARSSRWPQPRVADRDPDPRHCSGTIPCRCFAGNHTVLVGQSICSGRSGLLQACWPPCQVWSPTWALSRNAWGAAELWTLSGVLEGAVRYPWVSLPATDGVSGHALFYILQIIELLLSWKLKLKYPGKGRSVLREILLGDQHKALCLEDGHLGSIFIRDGFHLRSFQFISCTSALGYTHSHIGSADFSPFSAKGP